jgi:hypothetical protein
LDEGKDKTKITNIVPPEYHKFLPLFSEAEANKLPPHHPYDHHIPLKEGFTPPFGPIYSLSRTELEALQKWLDKNLSKGFILASSSPASAPILFIKKGDGSLCLCVDYRGLNEGTMKNCYPLLLLHKTLLHLQKAKYFTKLDIHGAYNLVRMAEGEEWKTVMGQLGTGAGSRELATAWGAMQERGLGIWCLGRGQAGPVSRKVR